MHAWTYFGIKTTEDGISVEGGIAVYLYCTVNEQ